MEGQSFNFDGILQSVLQNPEMLKSAIELAGKLSEGDGLSSLFSPKTEEPTEEVKAEAVESHAVIAKAETRKSGDMWRHRKLLEALSLYVSEDKRDKFELILKLFDFIELAEHIKR